MGWNLNLEWLHLFLPVFVVSGTEYSGPNIKNLCKGKTIVRSKIKTKSAIWDNGTQKMQLESWNGRWNYFCDQRLWVRSLSLKRPKHSGYLRAFTDPAPVPVISTVSLHSLWEDNIFGHVCLLWLPAAWGECKCVFFRPHPHSHNTIYHCHDWNVMNDFIGGSKAEDFSLPPPPNKQTKISFIS